MALRSANIADLVRPDRNGEGDADRDALIFASDVQDAHLSLADLNARVDAAARRIAGDLARRSGARTIGVLGANTPEHLIACLAGLRAGAVVVPINYKLKAGGVAHICDDADIACLYADEEHAALAPRGVDVEPLPAVDHASEKAGDAAPMSGADGSDVAFIMYTSGSTGRPKGVAISHRGYLWALEQFAFLRPSIEGERLVVAAPLYHMNAQFHVLTALKFGGAAVLMRTFDAATFLAAAERFDAARLTGVPTMFELAVRAVEAGEAPAPAAVRSIAMGSAPVTQGLVNRLKATFPDAAVSNGYGTTEAGPAIFGAHPDGRATPDLSIGYPMAGVSARLAGPDGRDADAGVLHVKSPMTAQGYLNRPAETAARFDDGWFVTGDVMRRDAAGFYYFVGRDDDMFVCGGENVYPGAVEEILNSIDGVDQSAVVPLTDGVKGAVPVAFVVSSGGLDEAAVKAAFLRVGPAYAHPRFVRFLKALPLSTVNKVDRRALSDDAARMFGGLRA
ncbi:MAG: class I adenylate-forming enzyme family protein [Pseudomonadota bacterium]